MSTIETYRVTGLFVNGPHKDFNDLDDAIEYAYSLTKRMNKKFGFSEKNRCDIETRVNGYANESGYSDQYPYEIVRAISDKTLEIRRMDAELAEGEKPHFLAGGYAGHCTNQWDLKYDITSNEENPIIRIRRNKKGNWVAGNRRFTLSQTPSYHYDYNF